MLGSPCSLTLHQADGESKLKLEKKLFAFAYEFRLHGGFLVTPRSEHNSYLVNPKGERRKSLQSCTGTDRRM